MPNPRPEPSGTLTMVEVAALWLVAGGSVSTAPQAVAHAWAESSGRTAVTSSNPDGGTNVGLWQLDTKGVGSGHSVTDLKNPVINARLTVQGSDDGRNWGPWPDDWQAHIDAAHQAVGQLSDQAHQNGSGISGWAEHIWHDAGKDLGKAVGAVGNLLSLPSAVTGFLGDLEAPVHAALWLVNPGNWARILAGVFGFLLLGGGLIVLAKAA